MTETHRSHGVAGAQLPQSQGTVHRGEARAERQISVRDDDRGARGTGADRQQGKDPLQCSTLDRAAQHGAATDRSGAPADHRGPEDHLLQRQRGNHRQQQPQPVTLALDLDAELAAAVALTQVPAQVRPPQRGATALGELHADLRARRLPRSLGGDQRAAGLEHEGLDLVGPDAEDVADLGVGQGVELGHDERGPLLLGQLGHVAEDLAQVLALLDLGRETLGGDLVELVSGLLAAGAQHRVAAVAGDGEQPRSDVDLLARVRQLAVGGEERVLDGILGLVRVAEHVSAKRQDRPVVAVIQRLERAVLTESDHLDQLVVGGQPPQAR
jgi:hypothetical protein